MRINILIPVYNDWESLNFLLSDISKIKDKNSSIISSIDVTVIDDSSTIDQKIENNFKNINFKLIKLVNNLGSQRAINTGLRYLNENNIDFDYCIVMDSDGEDRAEDILKLIKLAERESDKIIFASRAKREDGILFTFFIKFIYYFFIYQLEKI